MAIKKSLTYWGVQAESVEDLLHVGRVIEVRRYQDRRNMSDTLDYTDWRTVDCTDALVWLGPEGHPNGDTWQAVRPLEFHEQFIWVDCSNHFADRMHYTLHPEVDAVVGTSGDPLMWANFLAWKSHKEGIQRELVAQRNAEEQERQARRNAELAKRQELERKIAEEKETAEQLLRIYAPNKGSTVTVDDLTGTVFWMGVKYYRNKWRSTVGVKDKYGIAHWIDISKFMPPVEKKSRKRKAD